MGNPVFIFENFADTGILSGGSWETTLPLDNMQDPDIQVVARSTDATLTSTKFSIDLGREQPVGGLAFGPTNMSPGSTWIARAYSDAAMTAQVYSTGTQQVTGEVIDWTDTNDWLEWENPGFWLGIDDFASFTELPQFNYHVVAVADLALTTAQYWRLELSDTANADGHVDIGRLMIGRQYLPSYGYSVDNNFSIDPLVDVEESLGGLRSYWERGYRRSLRLTFPVLTDDELFDSVFRMMLRSGLSRQIFVVPDPSDASFGVRRSFLATFKTIPAIQQALMERGTTAMDFEEVL